MKVVKLFLLVVLFCPALSQALNYGVRVGAGSMTQMNSSAKTSYFETEFYGDHFFSESFAVRGSVFTRMSDEKDSLGAQVSLPVYLRLPEVGLKSYLAPGYRYASRGYHAPTVEGGVSITSFMNLGIGYRLIFNEWASNGLQDEGQLFISSGLNL